MKSLLQNTYLIFLILLLIPFEGQGQNTEHKDSSDIKLITAAREIMTAAGNCALITLDEEGRPRARAMDPFLPEKDLTVWFGTNSKSRKVDQIKKDPRVTLYYLDADASGYVMIHGKAVLVDDPEEKEKHWKDKWEAFYPNKSEDYLLIMVSPTWLELVSETRGIYGDSKTWQAPTLMFDSEK